MENIITEHNLLETGNLELLAKQVVEGFITGLHKSPFHGFSVEFAEHRQYNPGESIKHIDWKLFGRTEKLYTKRYEEETNLRCYMVIDNSASMYFPTDGMSKINFATYSAACITYMLKKQRDAVGLSILNDEIVFQGTDLANATYQATVHSWTPSNRQLDVVLTIGSYANTIGVDVVAIANNAASPSNAPAPPAPNDFNF